MLVKEHGVNNEMENAQAVGNEFIIRIPKTHVDVQETEGGLKLYRDPKWDEASLRAHYAYVVSAPKALPEVPKGCRIWFKHSVSPLERKQVTPQVLKDGYYWMVYDGSYENNINSQAICYEDENKDIKTLGWFTLVEPVGSMDEEVKSSLFEIATFKKTKMNLGKIFSISDNAKEMFGVDVGDTIYYKNNQRYEVQIDGKTYYRVRPQGILGQWLEEEK
jgi:co-chaperonin GroES (HSP10)